MIDVASIARKDRRPGVVAAIVAILGVAAIAAYSALRRRPAAQAQWGDTPFGASARSKQAYEGAFGTSKAAPPL